MYIATFLLLAWGWWRCWSRHRDPLHPLVVLLPQFAFLYAYMPLVLVLEDPERFAHYGGGWDGLRSYQIKVVLLIALLYIGVTYATRHLTRTRSRWRVLRIRRPSRILRLSLLLGLVGLAAWLYMIEASGGFIASYGRAYGGGWVSSGYVREMRYLGLVGAVLVYLVRSGKGMRLADWAIVAVCIAPTLFHGLLGARRGPTFLAMMVLMGGYVYFMRTRVRTLWLVVGGLALGTLMLLLVANRQSIYLGANIEDVRGAGEFSLRWDSNEYLIGAAVMRYAEAYGSYYGLREIAWLTGRLLPKFIWPTVYDDLPEILGIDVDVRVNGGVPLDDLTTLSSWTPSVGSAEGFAGSLWLEFGWLSLAAAFAIGVFFGAMWSRARSRVTARIVYLIAIAFSVYLVMQALDPWLYRLLLFGLPAYFLGRAIKARHVTEAMARIAKGRITGLGPQAH